MKKNVLALSITAAIAGFGFSGGALAMTGTLQGATQDSGLFLNQDGVGQMLLVPYFTTQGTNNTLINITNTDSVHGKAVKVRFRGAANSDDVFDFQVFLSPGDVWTAGVVKGDKDISKLVITDNSCTKPAKAVLNAKSFLTARLDPTMTDAQKANGTREGYVEIFNMGDIPKDAWISQAAVVAGTNSGRLTGGTGSNATDNALYTAIKHIDKVAPCSNAAWTYLDEVNLRYDTSFATGGHGYAGLTAPTTGLMANWIVIDTVSQAAWSGAAAAIQSALTNAEYYAFETPVQGNVVYWPQTEVAVTAPTINNYSADPLFRTANVFTATPAADTSAAIDAAYYDLPDMSTPYVADARFATIAAAEVPLNQAALLTSALASTSSTNEFLVGSGIGASTDWVFSQPTRRYSTALDYAAIKATDDGRRFTDLFTNTVSSGYFVPANTRVAGATTTNGNGSQICVTGIAYKQIDQEETNLKGEVIVVVSPSTPADPLSFCGEATVLSINNGAPVAGSSSGALKASVAVKDLDVTFTAGWMTLTTPNSGSITGYRAGLPVLGSAFVRATNATTGAGFGAAYPHRATRSISQ